MDNHPNFGELTVTSGGDVRASYWVPGYVGEDVHGAPTYVFREECTDTFPQTADGEHQAWQWLHGVAAGFDRVLGEPELRNSPLRGIVFTARAVPLAVAS